MTIRAAMIEAARRKGCPESEIAKIVGEVDAEFTNREDRQELNCVEGEEEDVIAFCAELIDRATAGMLEQLDGRNRANN